MTIVKTDTLGRGRTSPEQRDAFLAAFDRSCMSGAAFARLHGIRYSTFAHWRQKRKQQQQSTEDSPSPAALFEEVEVRPSDSSNADLKIDLPGGASVTVSRPEQFPMVTALLKYLECAC
jgi:transposase-like protein